MKTAISQLINYFLINYLKKENILAKFFPLRTLRHEQLKSHRHCMN